MIIVWRRQWTVILSLLIISLVTIQSCVTFRETPKLLQEYLAKNSRNGKLRQYDVDGKTIHYAEAGDTLKPLVIFVHGSPGSMSAFIHFLSDTTLSKHAHLITTDRPGFGHSNFGIGERSLQRQAALLKPLLEKKTADEKVILVGHSLGGPVIARMAMDYSELVDGLVMVAASVDPELEPDELWFRAPLATPFLSWLLPRSLRASNEEIYHLKPELERLLPLWKEVTCPVVVIQGLNDNLVPAGNASFLQKVLVNGRVEVVEKANMNHFVPWTNPELIKEAAMKLMSSDSVFSITTDY